MAYVCILALGMQMVFEPGSEAESSFLSTWRAYHEYDLGHAQTPAEISTFTRAHPKPVGSSDGIFAFDFCVRCGIDGNGVVMYRCECCWQKNREVLVHPSCIEKDELRWICQADSHHWRCPDCRYARVKTSLSTWQVAFTQGAAFRLLQ